MRKCITQNYSNIMFKIAIGSFFKNKNVQKACSQASNISSQFAISSQKSILKKTIFIRNNEKNFTIHQYWVCRKTKQLFQQIHHNMLPCVGEYKVFQSSLYENLSSDPDEYKTKSFADTSQDGKKWKKNFINESRKSPKTKTIISITEKFFWRNCIRSN